MFVKTSRSLSTLPVQADISLNKVKALRALRPFELDRTRTRTPTPTRTPTRTPPSRTSTSTSTSPHRRHLTAVPCVSRPQSIASLSAGDIRNVADNSALGKGYVLPTKPLAGPTHRKRVYNTHDVLRIPQLCSHSAILSELRETESARRILAGLHELVGFFFRRRRRGRGRRGGGRRFRTGATWRTSTASTRSGRTCGTTRSPPDLGRTVRTPKPPRNRPHVQV